MDHVNEKSHFSSPQPDLFSGSCLIMFFLHLYYTPHSPSPRFFYPVINDGVTLTDYRPVRAVSMIYAPRSIVKEHRLAEAGCESR